MAPKFQVGDYVEGVSKQCLGKRGMVKLIRKESTRCYVFTVLWNDLEVDELKARALKLGEDPDGEAETEEEDDDDEEEEDHPEGRDDPENDNPQKDDDGSEGGGDMDVESHVCEDGYSSKRKFDVIDELCAGIIKKARFDDLAYL